MLGQVRLHGAQVRVRHVRLVQPRDCPDDAALRTLARDLGVESRVTFTGAQTEAEVLAVPPARRAKYLELIEGFA